MVLRDSNARILLFRPFSGEPAEDILRNLLPPRLGHNPVGVICEFFVGRYGLIFLRHFADDRCRRYPILSTCDHQDGTGHLGVIDPRCTSNTRR